MQVGSSKVNVLVVLDLQWTAHHDDIQWARLMLLERIAAVLMS